ncbi:trimeric intracellular cation channel family protein [Nonlabens ponticola]|uniref:Trimeric intracellular cation channel family protein n=1 Tax=Nonlabens ponticola TaxID=2496866 RepID=A0A3S9MXV7_9FLAO|nr:trimeric intracellular cation channel family protein [Nonlabens ponticola]AZQ43974.1 trimeric intracellular cation channel family protein [Nonlabens ponticola]
MNIIEIMDLLGTIAFAVSGALAAFSKRLDAFGIVIIAFVTSAGGGTLRDILIGVKPVSWMTNMNLVYTILICVVITFIFRTWLLKLRKTLFLFDAIGIGLYTIVGVEMGIQTGLHPFICITLGCITACFGGVIRDILVNEIPVIFRKNVYATACIFGGGVYFLLLKVGMLEQFVFPISAIAVIAMRVLAVVFKWQLPSPYGKAGGAQGMQTRF